MKLTALPVLVARPLAADYSASLKDLCAAAQVENEPTFVVPADAAAPRCPLHEQQRTVRHQQHEQEHDQFSHGQECGSAWFCHPAHIPLP